MSKRCWLLWSYHFAVRKTRRTAACVDSTPAGEAHGICLSIRRPRLTGRAFELCAANALAAGCRFIITRARLLQDAVAHAAMTTIVSCDHVEACKIGCQRDSGYAHSNEFIQRCYTSACSRTSWSSRAAHDRSAMVCTSSKPLGPP